MQGAGTTLWLLPDPLPDWCFQQLLLHVDEISYLQSLILASEESNLFSSLPAYDISQYPIAEGP